MQIPRYRTLTLKILGFGVLFGIGYLVFRPTLAAYFYLDDFGFLTISRYLHNPFYFFIKDHFPGSFFYRPMGMSLWWLSYKLFALNTYGHYFINLFIHCTSVFVLYHLLVSLHNNRVLSMLLAIVFLVHPVSISTTAWLSNRFDLLATLFVLSAILFFISYISERRNKFMLYSLLCMALAILSKEIAYLTPIVVTIIAFSFPAARQTSRRYRLGMLAPFYLVGIAFFTLRLMLLRGTEDLFYGENMVQAMISGLGKWLRFLPDFYFYSTKFGLLENPLRTAIVVFLILLILWVVFFLKRKEVRNRWYIALLGAGLVLLPAVIQSPVASVSLFITPGHEFNFNTFSVSRLYYLTLAGALIFLSFFITLLLPENKTRDSWDSKLFMLYLTVAAMVMVYGNHSFLIMKEWAKLTNGNDRGLIELANKAIAQTSLPQAACKIYFINTHPASWYFREFSDAIVKATSDDDTLIGRCLVQTEKAPFYHLMLRSDYEVSKIYPLENITIKGEQFAPTFIGNLAYLYLKILNVEEIAADKNAVFLEFTKGKFVDITDSVRSGEKKLGFFDNRTPH